MSTVLIIYYSSNSNGDDGNNNYDDGNNDDDDGNNDDRNYTRKLPITTLLLTFLAITRCHRQNYIRQSSRLMKATT